ncbi:UNVERIFIED_CONTAM: Tyrosine-protein kinase receptor tyro3 [Gekko kuhli]
MPIKLKVSQGQPVKLNCSLEGMEDPEMLWIKDGAVVQSVDQVYIPVDEEHWIGFLSQGNFGVMWRPPCLTNKMSVS